MRLNGKKFAPTVLVPVTSIATVTPPVTKWGNEGHQDPGVGGIVQVQAYGSAGERAVKSQVLFFGECLFDHDVFVLSLSCCSVYRMMIMLVLVAPRLSMHDTSTHAYDPPRSTYYKGNPKKT